MPASSDPYVDYGIAAASNSASSWDAAPGVQPRRAIAATPPPPPQELEELEEETDDEWRGWS